jgi:alpha-D-ribose 1-methylphosphonate 5-triphosphate synthase subunit PhnH
MTLDTPGFADPVLDSQATFRAVLDAMSRPGTLRTLGDSLTPPPPLNQAAAATLLTLIDDTTKLWLSPEFEPARDWIAFHCGAAWASVPGDAAFVLASALPDLATLSQGSDEEPEQSATVILQLAGLGTGPRLELSGPGLRAPAEFRAQGLPPDMPGIWERNRSLFPRGIDLILCSGTTVAALPRTLAVREG